MIYKILHRKLQIEQHELHYTMEVNSSLRKGKQFDYLLKTLISNMFPFMIYQIVCYNDLLSCQKVLDFFYLGGYIIVFTSSCL
jgi:hypothetical protein